MPAGAAVWRRVGTAPGRGRRAPRPAHRRAARPALGARRDVGAPSPATRAARRVRRRRARPRTCCACAACRESRDRRASSRRSAATRPARRRHHLRARRRARGRSCARPAGDAGAARRAGGRAARASSGDAVFADDERRVDEHRGRRPARGGLHARDRRVLHRRAGRRRADRRAGRVACVPRRHRRVRQRGEACAARRARRRLLARARRGVAPRCARAMADGARRRWRRRGRRRSRASPGRAAARADKPVGTVSRLRVAGGRGRRAHRARRYPRGDRDRRPRAVASRRALHRAAASCRSARRVSSRRSSQNVVRCDLALARPYRCAATVPTPSNRSSTKAARRTDGRTAEGTGARGGRRARSRSSSARARSCAWATTIARRRRRDLRPAALLARPRARHRRPARRAASSRSSVRSRSGKTTLVYHVIAEAQKRGGVCAFIDAEHAHRPAYASRIGVNVDDLLISQPDNGEQALEIAELLVRSGALDVVAVDSVAALVPKAEIEGEMGDSFVGLQARLMSQALRKLDRRRSAAPAPSASSRTSCARRSASCSARPRPRPAAARSSSTRRSASTSVASRRSRTAARRSATACASRSSRTRSRRRSGRPSSTSSTARASPGRARSSTSGSRRSIIQKSGSYFSFGEERLGQGRANAKAFLVEHPDTLAAILALIAEAEGLGLRGEELAAPAATAGGDPDAPPPDLGVPPLAVTNGVSAGD